MGTQGIIVPTHDRPASLRRTLQSVAPELSATDDLRVVDNNSGPETAGVCREFAPRVRCIREGQQGLSQARHAGADDRQPPARALRAFHRRWHRGHGRFDALMRLPQVEATRARLCGVPLHLARAALADLVAWHRSRMSGDRARAFAAETWSWFFTGFFRERCLARR